MYRDWKGIMIIGLNLTVQTPNPCRLASFCRSNSKKTLQVGEKRERQIGSLSVLIIIFFLQLAFIACSDQHVTDSLRSSIEGISYRNWKESNGWI
jgi:hypothetical protein